MSYSKAEQFTGRRGAAGRAFAAMVGKSIGSKGCLIAGFGLMTLNAVWLIYHTIVPNQEQLRPVEECSGEWPTSRRGPEN
jgi:hypothetical protein